MPSFWNQPVVVSYVAAADLSALQYTFVKLDSTGKVVAVAAITDIPVGVLQNAPKANETAEVVVIGGTKLKASAAITLPALIGTAADGKAVKLTFPAATAFVLGQTDTAAGGANEVIAAIVNCANPARGA